MDEVSAVDQFYSPVVVGFFASTAGESADRDKDSTVRSVSFDDATELPYVLDPDGRCVGLALNLDDFALARGLPSSDHVTAAVMGRRRKFDGIAEILII